jgi:hypothetical protein
MCFLGSGTNCLVSVKNCILLCKSAILTFGKKIAFCYAKSAILTFGKKNLI